MTDRKLNIADYIDEILNQRLPHLRESLRPLESGEMKLGESTRDGHWTDITGQHIDRLKRLIAEYEHIVELLKEKSQIM